MEHISFSGLYDLHLVDIKLPLIIEVLVLATRCLHLVSIQIAFQIELVSPAVSPLG